MKILFVSTGLQTGGAERMLLKLLQNIDRSRFDPVVVSLIDEGTLGGEIRKLGIPVITLRINTLQGVMTALWRLARITRKGRFDVIQGWMYHGNLFAWLGRLLSLRRAALCFGIRHTLYDLAREKRHTRAVIKANALLSRRTDSCMFNSEVSLSTHKKFGFASHSMEVIPNGFDIGAFGPSPACADALRLELELGQAPVVGMVARFDPAKDHRNFLAAASLVHAADPGVRFVLAGRNVDWGNGQLVAWIDEFGLRDVIRLLGERKDIPALNNLFDVACLSSYMEAFPNVVGEAMACATPCVVTDVGDCAAVVGETGMVVPPADHRALAYAIQSMLAMPVAKRAELGLTARQRISGLFELNNVVEKYMQFYKTAAARAAA